MRARGQMERMTPFMAPTWWSERPKSVVRVISGAGIVRMIKSAAFLLRSQRDNPGVSGSAGDRGGVSRSVAWGMHVLLSVTTCQWLLAPLVFFFKQKTAYEITR